MSAGLSVTERWSASSLPSGRDKAPTESPGSHRRYPRRMASQSSVAFVALPLLFASGLVALTASCSSDDTKAELAAKTAALAALEAEVARTKASLDGANAAIKQLTVERDEAKKARANADTDKTPQEAVEALRVLLENFVPDGKPRFRCGVRPPYGAQRSLGCTPVVPSSSGDEDGDEGGPGRVALWFEREGGQPGVLLVGKEGVEVKEVSRDNWSPASVAYEVVWKEGGSTLRIVPDGTEGTGVDVLTGELLCMDVDCDPEAD